MFKIPELCLPSVTILVFPDFDLSSTVYHFRRFNDIKLPMLLTVELKILIFDGLVLSLSEVIGSLSRGYLTSMTPLFWK